MTSFQLVNNTFIIYIETIRNIYPYFGTIVVLYTTRGTSHFLNGTSDFYQVSSPGQETENNNLVSPEDMKLFKNTESKRPQYIYVILKKMIIKCHKSNDPCC